MRNLKIALLALLAVVLLPSCEDSTGEFVVQLHTNAEKDQAFRACLTASLDSAAGHLLVPGGYYAYAGGRYRIGFKPLQHSVFDTLARYDMAFLADSLVAKTNKLAESCGASAKEAFKQAIASVEFYDYDRLLYGDSTAITGYFRTFKSDELASALQNPVAIRLPLYEVQSCWNQVVSAYARYASEPVSFDLQGYIVGEMLDGIFREMALEEINIRTDSTHRSENDSILGL